MILINLYCCSFFLEIYSHIHLIVLMVSHRDNQLTWRHIILNLKFNEDKSFTNALSSLNFALIDCMLKLRILKCLLLFLATE